MRHPPIPYSKPTLAVLSCVFLLTEDTGRGASTDDVQGLLREKCRMSEAEADAAIEVAVLEGAIEP